MRKATSSSSEVLRRCGPLWGIGAFITGGSVASVASRIEGVKMSKPKNKTEQIKSYIKTVLFPNTSKSYLSFDLIP